MRAITYCIYILIYEVLCLAGPAYLVVWHNATGWWVLLGLLMSGAGYRPNEWIHVRLPSDE